MAINRYAFEIVLMKYRSPLLVNILNLIYNTKFMPKIHQIFYTRQGPLNVYLTYLNYNIIFFMAQFAQGSGRKRSGG
jgi:hypothetical protein